MLMDWRINSVNMSVLLTLMPRFDEKPQSFRNSLVDSKEYAEPNKNTQYNFEKRRMHLEDILYYLKIYYEATVTRT